MKIQSKVMVLLLGLFVILGAAQFIVLRKVLLPSFSELERQAARRDMDRVQHALERESEALSVVGRDWSHWTEAYRFVSGRNQRFVATNLYEGGIRSLRVNAVAFFDQDGRVIWSAGRDIETHQVLTIDLLGAGGLSEEHSLRAAIRRGEPTAGFVTTSQGPMLTVLTRVQNGETPSPFRGMELLGKLLTESELNRIGTQAQVRLTRVADYSVGPHSATLLPELVELPDATEVNRTFRDFGGAVALTLKIQVPRTISAHGRQAVGYAFASVAAIGAIVLALLMALLDRSVLQPLARITRHAIGVGRHDDLAAHLTLRRKDELGDLAREFDRMVDRLAEARRRLLDRSYEAGIAENASGVLHNLGNAMTPLCTQVAALQETLRSAPDADIETALTELETRPMSAERQTDLQTFLRLASRELVGSVTMARERLDSLARSTALIQDVVAAQGPRARTERTLEPVELPTFLSDSAALVPPELCARLAISLDPSLHAIGAIMLPRTVLQQVVQNIIVNAAEAVRSAEQARGALRIAAQVTTIGTTSLLELSFADDGIGIDDTDLQRVFDKGYSTKSRTTNSGIGLHWCAIVVGALGGRLSAASPGNMRGTTIYLAVPLVRAADLNMPRVA